MNSLRHSSEFGDSPRAYLYKNSQASLEKRVSNYLKGVPIIFSNFVCSYSGIRSLLFENGRYCIGYDDASTGPLARESQKELQNAIAIFELMFSHEIAMVAKDYPWTPHYTIHTEPESGQSQLFLEFRMRESGQLVQDTQAAVITNYE